MVHVIFIQKNEDIEEGSCAITLYRTKDKEIFTAEKDAYQYLYEKAKRDQNPPKIIKKKSTLQKQQIQG